MITNKLRSFLFSGILLLFFANTFSQSIGKSNSRKRNIVLIAGEKTHGPGFHEYIKTVRQLNVMLDHSNVKNISTTFVLHSWPKDISILDKADLILFFTDGGEGDSTMYPPFMKPGRMEIMEREMKRGCGFSLIHYATFSPDDYGKKVLEWGGGYFDWQNDKGENEYYSAIKTTEGTVTFPDSTNPITRGVHPFKFQEEFYYDIRFRDNDPRLKPIVVIPELDAKHENGKVVAWAIQRADKGRGFSTSMGHYYANWENPDFRKLFLNGIVWAAGAAVPPNGVETRVFTDQEVTKELYAKNEKALYIPQKNNYDISVSSKGLINIGKEVRIDTATNIEDLKQYDLKDYHLIMMQNVNLDDSLQISSNAKKALLNFLKDGGGLFILPAKSSQIK